MKKELKLGLAALLICSSTSLFADDSFQWHGYMRSSYGLNLDLKSVNKFDENAIGRGGNEYDSFLTSTFSKRWTNARGEWAQYNFGLVKWYNTTVDPDSGDLNLADNVVSMGGFSFLPKDSSIWLGKIKIFKDLGLLDYKYTDLDGKGIGYKSKKLDLTFVVKDTIYSPYVNTGSGDDVVAVDAKYRLNNLETQVTLSKVATDSLTTDQAAEGETSLSLLAAYNSKKFMGVLPGSTTYRVQLAKGLVAHNGQGNLLNSNNVTDKDDSAFRFAVDANYFSKNISVNPVIMIENSKDDSADLTETVVSAGARVTQKLNNNFSMIYEGFVANKENEGWKKDADGKEYKISAGPAIQLDVNPYVRPIIRLSAAVVGGDKEVTGLDKTSELRLGAQFETWF